MEFLNKYINNFDEEFEPIEITKYNIDSINGNYLAGILSDSVLSVGHTMMEVNYINIFRQSDNPHWIGFETGQEKEKDLIQVQSQFEIDLEEAARVEITHECFVQGFEVDENEKPIGDADVYGFKIKAYDEEDDEIDIEVKYITDRYLSFGE